MRINDIVITKYPHDNAYIEEVQPFNHCKAKIINIDHIGDNDVAYLEFTDPEIQQQYVQAYTTYGLKQTNGWNFFEFELLKADMTLTEYTSQKGGI